MAKDVRARMIAGAMRLLASNGVQKTSIQNVTEATQTPRGSIYHFFPGGKEQMIEEALQLSCGSLLERLSSAPLPDPESVTRAFVDVWRYVLTATQYGAGCAVVGVAVTFDTEHQREMANAIFETWSTQLADLLRHAGLSSVAAEDFAQLLSAACEGAVVLCRTSRSLEPLNVVERQLLEMAHRHASADALI